MIEINEYKLPITAREATAYIQSETDRFGVFLDVDRMSELIALYTFNNIKLITQIQMLLNTTIWTIDSRTMRELLIKAGVSDAMMRKKDTGSPSFADDVRQELLKRPEIPQHIKDSIVVYDTYSKNKQRISYLNSYINKGTYCNGLSFNGHRMVVVHPTWHVLNTGRIQATEPNVQQIPREIPDIVTAPEGYTLMRADSSQIEPRINFSTFLRDDLIMKLITHYEDAYFGILHYCLLTPGDMAKLRENFDANFKPMEITDDVKSKRQNIKRLTNAGSYGSTNLGGINLELASAYEDRIVKHPKRIALQQKVTEEVKRGNDTFYGMFGTPVKPDITQKYTPGSSGWINHVIRCGINNPIQTTASELMMFSVDKARRVLSKSRNSHICFYKHDEACFYISNEDIEAGIGKELEDVTAYQVAGWLPIPNEPEYGVKKGALATLL